MKKLIIVLCALTLIGSACNQKKATEDKPAATDDAGKMMDNKTERNKKVVMASMESFGKGDFDGTFKDVSPNFVDKGDNTGPAFSNVDTLKAFIKMVVGSLENYKGENLQYYADGDHVLVVGDWTGVFKKDLMGIKATGKPFRFRDVDIFTLNDEGKITEHSSVQNLAQALTYSGTMK